MWVSAPALLPWLCGVRAQGDRGWRALPTRLPSSMMFRAGCPRPYRDDLQYCQAHGDACLRGDDPGAPALPRHGASSETVTVAPGIEALYAVPMSSRVTRLAACVIVVLMTFSNAVTGSSSSGVVTGHLD